MRCAINGRKEERKEQSPGPPTSYCSETPTLSAVSSPGSEKATRVRVVWHVLARSVGVVQPGVLKAQKLTPIRRKTISLKKNGGSLPLFPRSPSFSDDVVSLESADDLVF